MEIWIEKVNSFDLLQPPDQSPPLAPSLGCHLSNPQLIETHRAELRAKSIEHH